MLRSWMAASAGRCCALFLLIGLAAPVSAQEESTATDRLLPPETFVYITCPSVDDLKARFSESSAGRLWADASMKPFRDEIETNLDKAAEEFESKVGLPLVDVLGLPKGEASFAVAKAGANELGLILFADVGEDHETLEKVLERIEEKLEENEATQSSETVDDVEITIFTLKAAEGAEGKPKSVSYFVKDSFVVISSSTALLKASLERWDGQHSETFAESELYQEIVSACRESDDAESDLYYFADPVSLISSALSSDPSQAMASMMFSANLSKVGLDKLKAIGGASSLKSDDFESVTRTLIVTEQPLTGLPKVFRMPARPQAPPAWVDQSVSQYSSISWDPPGAYAAIGEIYEGVTGQPGGFDAAVDQIAQHPANPGIHPKKDFFDQMSGLIHFIGGKSSEEAESAQQMLFALGIKDDVHMQSVLEKISSKIPNLMKRDFEGTTIYDIEAGGGEASPAIAVSRNHLFISTHVAQLEETLRGGTSAAEPLTGSDEYQAVAKHFPTQVSSLGFAKAGSEVEAIWKQARSGAFAEQVEGIDFTKLPEFETVKKYFSASGSYIEPHEKGAIIVQFALPTE